MPIYEYRCVSCQHRVSIFVKGFDDPMSLECPSCGVRELSRLFSRFSIGKGEFYQRKGIYEDILGDNQLVRGLKASDPRAMAEWSRRMSHGAGEDITPDGEEILGKLDAGEPIGKVASEAKAAVGCLGGGEV